MGVNHDKAMAREIRKNVRGAPRCGLLWGVSRVAVGHEVRCTRAKDHPGWHENRKEKVSWTIRGMSNGRRSR